MLESSIYVKKFFFFEPRSLGSKIKSVPEQNCCSGKRKQNKWEEAWEKKGFLFKESGNRLAKNRSFSIEVKLCTKKTTDRGIILNNLWPHRRHLELVISSCLDYLDGIYTTYSSCFFSWQGNACWPLRLSTSNYFLQTTAGSVTRFKGETEYYRIFEV